MACTAVWLPIRVLGRLSGILGLGFWPSHRPLLSRVCSSLQLRNPSFNIFEFNRLGRMVQHAVGSPCFRRRGRGRVDHEPEEYRDRRTGSLLKACDGLSKCGPARFAVRRVEIRVFQPAQERGRADSDRAGRLLDVLLGEKGDDRLFLLAFVFRSVALHLRLPAITGVIAFPSPFPFCHRIRLPPVPARVIDVVTR